MKLLRFGEPGNERPGILAADGSVRDLSMHARDIDAELLDKRRLSVLGSINPDTLPPAPGVVRLGPCVAPTGKIVGVGLNYVDHAREANMPVPKEPVLFIKGARLSGPDDPIYIPAGSCKTDWEIELAIVIGSEALNVRQTAALDYVAGFAVFVDVSERAWQIERGGQWDKGKSYPSFAPIGPWLVTADEISQPQELRLWLDVNGVRRQEARTSNMIFGVSALVSYISGFMALYPGDVIATGTPSGVGMGIKPEAVFLSVGDVLRCGIEGLGEQRHRCDSFLSA